jgi:hypothetical protein
VTYWISGVSYGHETVDDGTPALGPTTDPDDPLGAFIGWYQNPGDAYPVDLNTLLITADLDLYAKFSDTEGIVRFRDFNGDIIFNVTAATIADITSLPTEAQAQLPAGKTIQYWYVTGGSTDYFSQAPTTPVRGLITLLPKVLGLHTISFNSQGGTALSPINVNDGDCIPTPLPSPTKSGYTFQHWSLDINGLAYDLTTPVTENLVLYAVWDSPAMVGFQLYYHSADYTYFQGYNPNPEWTERTHVVVVDPMDCRPVGSTLTAAEIKVLAEKYQSAAIASLGNNFPFYYYEYYENTSATISKPRQNGALNANGTTDIHVYFVPIPFEITFDLSGYPGAKITYNSIDYFNAEYKMDASYYMYINEPYTDKWPMAEGVRTTGGAIVTPPHRLCADRMEHSWQPVRVGDLYSGLTDRF